MLAVPLFHGLGRTDLDGDEAIYAGVVERMVAGGPWLTPPEENGAFLEKPPLRFWLVAGTMAAGLLRPTEGGHRLVDTTLSALAIVYVFAIARRLGGLAAGVGAVFLTIATEPLLFTHGLRSGTMEPLLVLSYCGAVAHFLRWAEEAGRRHVIAVGAWCGVAVLAKFAAAAPLLLILAAAMLVVPRWRARASADRRTWMIASGLFALVAVPWFVLQTVQYGLGVWGWILGHHVLARVASWVDPGHVQPWWYYLSFVARTFEGTWYYVAAGAVVLLWRLRTRSDPAVVLLALWLAVPVVLFSLATSKLIHYVYPALPALAVIGGQAFAAAVTLIRGAARRDPPRLRIRAAAAVVATLALTATLVVLSMRRTVMVGPYMVHLVSPEPALLAALAALVVAAGRVRAAAALLVLALVASDVDREYARAMVYARRRGRPLGLLVDCVSARAGRPIAFHVHVDRELGRDEKYYFRRVGLVQRPESDPEQLASRLLFATEPQVITIDQYRRLVTAMEAWPPEAHAAASVTVLPHRRLVVFLPGESRPCAAAARRIP